MDKSVLRNKSIGTKVSEVEYAELEKLAENRGVTLSEWLRELALGQLVAQPAEQVILAEILALRTLYVNTIQILGSGRRDLTTEDLRKLIERVDREKQRKAQERLGRPEKLSA